MNKHIHIAIAINDAAVKSVHLADEMYPYDGFLSDWDYPDHVRRIREKLSEPDGIQFLIDETIAYAREFLDDGYPLAGYADTMRALCFLKSIRETVDAFRFIQKISE